MAYAPYGQQYVGTAVDNWFTGAADSAEAADFKNFPERNYHTYQGRWLTPDPVGLAAVDLTNPQSWNRYAYVGNNPLAMVDPTGLDGCNVWNVTYEGSGPNFPCDASQHYGGPAESPTSIVSGPGVALGSMIGYQSPEINEGLNTYLATVRGGGYTCGAPCGWGWVAGDDPAYILGFRALAAANAVRGAAVEAWQLLQQPSCAALFQLGPGTTAWNLLPKIQFSQGPAFPTDANATTNSAGTSIVFNIPNPEHNPLLPDYPSPYLSETPAKAGQTIIHELLHAVYASSFYGPQAINAGSAGGYPFHWTQNDVNNQTGNAIIVQDACPVGN